MGVRQGALLAGMLLGAAAGLGQEPGTQVAAPAAVQAQTGGTIRGTVKAGTTPLPGVAITATNTLTGKKYATTTDENGAYAMAIPRTGRYVVKAELAAFAPVTSEVRLTAEATDQVAAFGLQLASRVAQADAGTTGGRGAGNLASLLRGGTQALNVSGDASLADASAGGGGAAALPSLGGLGSDSGATDSVAVSGQLGQTNGLASLSEDQVRDRIQEAVDGARARGAVSGGEADAIVSLLGGLIAGPGGGGGGRGGGRGGGGSGAFRGFNPTQTHGNLFYQGGFSALDAQAFSLSGISQPKPNSYQNRFGASITGSPAIPGLFKASTKQFVFLNITGQRNITPLNLYGTVPTALERAGDFSESNAIYNGLQVTPTLYDPATGQLTQPGPQSCAAAASGQSCVGKVIPVITPQALALVNLYPLPNAAGLIGRNYQNVTTQGANTTNIASRYVRNFGAQPVFGQRRSRADQPKALRQNINVGFNYSHSASDLRNFVPVLGGKTFSDGYNLSAGYTVGYGKLNNNFSVNWNRTHALQTNYFTDTGIDPSAQISLPDKQGTLAQGGFYNGVPQIVANPFSPLSDVQPRNAINQTISFSDSVGVQVAKHNLRFGADVRRVHADQIGGNNVLGTFNFSGLVTESPVDRQQTLNPDPTKPATVASGSAFADFLLGQPQQTKIQGGLFKTYLRENVYDLYGQDDYRLKAGLSFNYGLRYEYFAPYTEKNGRLVNLDHNADFTSVDQVFPNGTGTYLGSYPRSLVNPDHTLVSPRFGVAYRPKFVKDTVIRAGYGLNFNTGQFAVFAQSLAYQPPFAATQNNVLSTGTNATGCVITSPGVTTNLTLANGFQCGAKAIQNIYAVNKDYRLGHVQVYNVDLQHTFPRGTVVNVGYNGSKGGNLDIVRAPNVTLTSVTTPNAVAFTYEDSVAESRLNQLVVSARKRLEKGVSLQMVYQYSHSIDNASSIGGSAVSQVQDDRRLDLEEGNSSFDVRHRLTGNFLYELPFGPNREFLAKGGPWSKVLDGFGISGNFTLATGTYLSPQYTNTTLELAAGGTYTLRPDRVFSQPIRGPRNSQQFFNKAAFTTPAGYGTASRSSIEGPASVAFDMSLSRSFSFGNTRSLETRLTATNALNVVTFSGVDTTVNSGSFGQVTSTAPQRQVTLLGRYRF